MKVRGGILLALVAGLAAAVASTAGAGSTTAARSQAVSCKGTLKVGFAAPFTGGAAFLGNEQLSWAKYAIKTLAPKYGLKISLVTGDIPVESGPAGALTVAQKFVADKNVVVMIGPSTSGSVAASSKTYYDGGLAHITASATRTSLTKGAVKEATPYFFRVVSGDYIQGPQDAKFMIKKGAKNVVVFDFQEPYSQGLAAAAEAVFKAGNVTVTHLSVANTVTDFSSFVTKVPSNADFVFFPTQKPADAQNFAQQLIEQGKKAKVFGGDGAASADQFKVPGSYVSVFSSGHQHHPVRQAAHRGMAEGQSEAQPRPVRACAVPLGAGCSERRQAGLRRGQRSDQGPARRRTERQEDLREELDPRRQLPFLDEVERPAERRVLHLRDPVERHVQGHHSVHH